MISNFPNSGETTFWLKQTFPASQTRVFNAWTQPDIFKQWWGPPGCTTRSVEIDLQVGGQYRIGLQFPEEDIFYIYGTYRAIEPPDKLVFTWNCDKPELDFGESVVTLEFSNLENQTEISLVHEQILSQDAMKSYGGSWYVLFEKLIEHLEIEEG